MKKEVSENKTALQEKTEPVLENPGMEETVQEEASAISKKSAEKEEKKPLKIVYYEDAKVICSSCNTSFTVGSTKPEIHVEVCSNCHPLYTGKAKFVDTEGRVEAFQRRESLKKEPKEKKKVTTEPEQPKTLKEMLELIQSGQ